MFNQNFLYNINYTKYKHNIVSTVAALSDVQQDVVDGTANASFLVSSQSMVVWLAVLSVVLASFCAYKAAMVIKRLRSKPAFKKLSTSHDLQFKSVSETSSAVIMPDSPGSGSLRDTISTSDVSSVPSSYIPHGKRIQPDYKQCGAMTPGAQIPITTEISLANDRVQLSEGTMDIN